MASTASRPSGSASSTASSRPERRFQQRGREKGITVIDDFAHNPDKIDATLATLRAQPGRLLIMFQPHGYGPLSKMGEQLALSFANGLGADDRLYLPNPVYQGGTVERTRGSDQAEHISDRAAIGEALLSEAQEGDRIVIMGARDDSLSEFAAELVERLAERNS